MMTCIWFESVAGSKQGDTGAVTKPTKGGGGNPKKEKTPEQKALDEAYNNANGPHFLCLRMYFQVIVGYVVAN